MAYNGDGVHDCVAGLSTKLNAQYLTESEPFPIVAVLPVISNVARV